MKIESNRQTCINNNIIKTAKWGWIYSAERMMKKLFSAEILISLMLKLLKVGTEEGRG